MRAWHRIRLPLTLGLLALMWGGLGCEGSGGGVDPQRNIDEPDRGLPAPPPDAFVEVDGGVEVPEGPIINSIIPARGPVEGGTQVRIVGQRFIPGTTVQIGPRACTDPVVESENHILCDIPPTEMPGVVSVFVRWPEGGEPSRADDAFTYYESLEVASLSPDRAPASGGVQVSIEGRGFLEPTQVRFGDTPAESVTVVDANRILATAPPNTPGVYDVVLSNPNGQLRLPEAFSYTEALTVQRIAPRWGFLEGGTEIALQGSGLAETSEVLIGGRPADLLASEVGRARLRLLTPPGAAAGPADVSVSNVNGAWAGSEAFFYVDGAVQTFGIQGVIPRALPTLGGDFWVVGGGFTDTTEVEVSGVSTPCALEAPQVLACTAGPHPEGAADVTVREGGEVDTARGALEFYTQVQVFNVNPPRGAVAGGAVVEIIGAGFDERLTLTLDGEDMRVLEIIDDGRALAVVPPGRAGAVDLTAANVQSVALLDEAYEYFNPTSRFGGIWGDVIQGAVNFTLLDYYTGEPIEGATVIVEALEAAGGAPLTAYTNVEGHATVSEWGLRGPVMATGAAPGYEANTFDRISTENVTMYLRPFQPPEGGGGQPQDPIPPGHITGRITGLSDLEKPLDENLLLVAFVDTTHTAIGNRSFLPSPQPNGILFEDGDFDIFTRPGELAVVVTAGYVSRSSFRAFSDGIVDYWGMRSTVTPLAMGMQRFLSLSPGEEVSGLNIPLDIPCDADVPITLGNPPGGEPGAPEVYTVQVHLDLGSEGYWTLDTETEGRTPLLQMPHMPGLSALDADITVQWYADARPPERDAEGLPVSRYPYSVALEEHREYTEGVEIGPFVGTPVPITPTEEIPLGRDRRLSWRFHEGVNGPIEPADATVIRILNQTGRTLWTVVTPGALTEINLPHLPLELGEVGITEDAAMFLSIVPFISEGRFDYAEFTYNELLGAFQTSYSVNTFTFDP